MNYSWRCLLIAVLGRLGFAALELYLMFFTDSGSTGLVIMFLVDTIGALCLGSTIGFQWPARGKFSADLTKKKQ